MKPRRTTGSSNARKTCRIISNRIKTKGYLCLKPQENQQDPLQAGRILQCGLAFWEAKALLSAVELGVFTLLAKKPLGLKELEERLGLHPRGTRDFFDALFALGFLKREGGKYSNAPETNFFLDKAKPSYMGGILEMAERRSYTLWGSLTGALKAGSYQSETSGGSEFFEKLYSTPAKLKEFLSAMTGVSMPANVEMGRKFPWAKYRTFVDVGAAQGGLPVQIALQHPHLTGTGFDIAPVRPVFEEYVSSFGLLMSLNRLLETPGGFDFTGADCQQSMSEAGFRETRVDHLTGPDSIVVGIK